MRRSIVVTKSSEVSAEKEKQKTDSRMEGGELVEEVRELKKVMVELVLVLRRLSVQSCPVQEEKGEDTCERWFKRFRSGDFNVSDKEREN